MANILKDKEAQKICYEIIDSELLSGNYDKHIGTKGYWLEDGKYVAFDNSTGDMWMEEFETEKEAIKYLET